MPGPRDQGLPYPGVITLDSDGCVTDKQFQLPYRVRPSAATVLTGLDLALDASTAIERTTRSEYLTATARLGQRYYYPYQRLSFSFDVGIAPGLHVYAAPVPNGLVAFGIEVGPIEGLVVGAAVLPAPVPYQMDGLDEPLFAYEGAFRATLPLEVHRAAGDLELDFAIRYQACSADLCYPPARVGITMQIDGRESIRA